MPPVSQRYRDARRRQVIDAARRCFARTGFAATSMQEICAQAQLSAGAVYGYFPSKNALIATIVEEVAAELTAGLDELGHDDSPELHDVITRLLTVSERSDRGVELANLAVQVWADATRDPVLNARLSAHHRALHTTLTHLVERCQQAGTAPPDVHPGDLAYVIAALVPAFFSQRALLGPSITVEAFTNGLTSLTGLSIRHSKGIA